MRLHFPRRRVIQCAIGAVAVLGLLSFCSYLSPFNKAPFDAARWRSPEHEDARCGMVDDLRSRLLGRGQDMRGVTAVLGEPHPSRERVSSYYLGYCSTSFDPDTLDIAFDEQGKITSVEVVTH
ncbi:hypothetical protein G4G28_01850 [Massilia sp. Dwa41.01b]|uniref:hypothetical protein n=1 Tax=unclassified Massilia TaxID=2609279 RepID=UPI0015FF6D9A|nr:MULTISPECIES: hypothetical protein [unclassified Massilia]QNA87520.1 hypothetical protein G4G28_01850 [Massilia sp. Dwa41.01b]QNA98427.1 hypothetical protein G4G31_05615 [Massilia sp. Se16.2.3]